MDFKNMNAQWLQAQQFSVKPGLTIAGTYLRELEPKVDGRGDVTELWSEAWVDNEHVLPVKHAYQSATDFNVVKCWHLHEIHTDQFTVTRGKLQVSLVDLREDSPTFLEVNKIILSTEKPRFLKIAPGILHGWKALSAPEVLVVNFQTEVYDSVDEIKFPWDCVLADIWEPRNG